jgi:uncharacterized protein
LSRKIEVVEYQSTDHLNSIYNEAGRSDLLLGPITEVILQPTSFCNLRCKYCYLSEESRSTKNKMKPETARDIIKFIVDSGYANNKLVVRWHAGEPLAAGLDFYQNAIPLMDKVLPEGYKIIHTLQTNGVYINDEWCDFFKENSIVVGVSIDGPEFLNDKNRVTPKGSGTFNLTMRGINFLKKHNIPFDTISVITYDSLANAEKFYNFFEGLGVRYIAYNIEESEGYNSSSLLKKDDFLPKYVAFFSKLYELEKLGKTKIREVRERHYGILYGVEQIETIMSKPFFMMNFDFEGNFSTFCPEMLDVDTELYGPFNFGNIYSNKLKDVLDSEKYSKVWRDIQLGIEACKNECKYFSLCGGGAPANKLFENGSFNSTETFYCISKIKIPTDIICEDLILEKQKSV